MPSVLANILPTALRHKLTACLLENEEHLMDSVLDYAVRYNYAQYTSTLKEAWRISVSGLTMSFTSALDDEDYILELGPDQDFRSDLIASFAIIEAKRHRERGIRLEMFLGLLKYYRQSYHDVIHADPGLTAGEKEVCCYVIYRFFDHIEIGFCAEWSASGSTHLTELQGANRIVTNEKNKYLTIFESLPFPVILLKANLQIDNLNHAAALFLGGKALPGAHYYGSSFDLSSKCVYDKQDEQGKPSLPDWLLAKIKIFSSEKNAQEYYFEKEVEAAGDKQIYVIQFSKMRDISGKFSGSVVMIQDFTEARKSVKEQSRMKEQLLQSDRMASIGQLAAGVAHEINNPIGFVGSNLNRLSEYTDDLVGLIANYRKFISAVEIAVYDKTELNTSLSHILQIESDADVAFLCSDIQAVIKESQEGTDRVRKIVADLKDFAQPGIAKPQFADINRCIESTVNMLSNKIKNKAEVIRNFGEIPEIFCQPCQLNQVFMSIIENAVQSIDKDGQIRIITQKNGQFIQVRISDSGCGIEPDHIKHIFEPFFTTKPVGAGTGLGLHLAYQIIKQHEGFIFVTSQPGQGTTFTIDLPLQPSCETDGE